MNYEVVITGEDYYVGEDVLPVFGLKVIWKSGEMRQFPALSTSEEKVKRASELIKDGDISPVHLDDIIEDLFFV